MDKTQTLGMQHNPGKFIPMVFGCFVPVHGIPRNRMIQRRKMNPDLVRSASAYPAFDQGEFFPV